MATLTQGAGPENRIHLTDVYTGDYFEAPNFAPTVPHSIPGESKNEVSGNTQSSASLTDSSKTLETGVGVGEVVAETGEKEYEAVAGKAVAGKAVAGKAVAGKAVAGGDVKVGDVTAGAENGVVEGAPESPPRDVISPKRLRIIVCALCMCVLMAAMDQTIVTTAIPVIAEQFKSGSGYTWIGTAYLLMASAFLPSWGKFSDIFGRKPVLLSACTIFLVGSIATALARNIATIIAGRAVQGLGAGGLLGLVNITISDLVPVRERGIYLAFVGFTWAFASAIGPVLGGVFTQYASWRWCFWINVPITAIAMIAIIVFLHLHSPRITFAQGLKRVDWLGSLFIVTGTVLFLLGLEFGGVQKPWDSPIVITFILFGLLVMVAFGFVEWKQAKYPIMPIRLFRHTTNIASYICCFFHGFVFISGCYFLPLYFQAVRGSSVLMSGVSILPYVLSLSILSAVNGGIISKTGRYQEPIWGGSILLILGTGLLADLDRTSSWAKLILYQLIAGAGAGPGFQGPLIAIHSTIEQVDVGVATTAYAWLRNLATAMGICLGLVVFQNVMEKELEVGLRGSLAGGGVVREEVWRYFMESGGGGGASANVPYISTLQTGEREAVRDVYAKGLRAMWWFFLACAVLSGLASLGIGKHHLSKTVQSNQPAKRKVWGKKGGEVGGEEKEKEVGGQRERDVEVGKGEEKI